MTSLVSHTVLTLAGMGVIGAAWLTGHVSADAALPVISALSLSSGAAGALGRR